MSSATLNSRLHRTVRRLLAEYRPDELVNQRCETRHPFFRPATVSHCEDDSPPIFAFTRDLSLHGIGLIHSEPLTRGEVIILVHGVVGHPVWLRACIEWCRTWDDPWCLSGGRLLDLVD